MIQEQLLERLRGRGAPMMRLPASEQPEDDMDMAEKHSFSGDDLARMAVRMARALRKLKLPEGGGGRLVLAAPAHTLEWMMLWLGAVLSGREVLLPAAGEALPREVAALVCPPAAKAAWQEVARERGARLATLGGHWEGSLFMLQMVQPNEAEGVFDAEAGHTRFGDGEVIALDALLARAKTFAADNGLARAPAVLASLPALDSAQYLVAGLAALLADAPLYWIAPGMRKQALKKLPDLPDGALALGDAAFVGARRWNQAVQVGNY